MEQENNVDAGAKHTPRYCSCVARINQREHAALISMPSSQELGGMVSQKLEFPS